MANYSSTGEVKAFTRHLLDGQSGFNSTTRPTGTELERFLVRASSYLDMALIGAGLAAPVTNSTAKPILDDWVTMRGAAYVELTQRGAGFGSGENTREQFFMSLAPEAREFVGGFRLALARAGVTVNHGMAEALSFTGLDAESERADPDDTSLAQPLFIRNLFDQPTGSGRDDTDQDGT